MTSQGNLAGLGIILNFPSWPDSRRYADRPVVEQERALGTRPSALSRAT